MYVYYVLTRCDGMRSESRFRSSVRTARRDRSATTTRTVREATEHAMFDNSAKAWHAINRRHFIGGSDVRIIMGGDEAALLRLWREKRGEAEPEDLSGNLIVQLGFATEPLNRQWYDRASGQRCPKLGAPPGDPLDGCHAGRHRRRHRRSVRSQIHAAVVVLGGGSGGEAHGPAPA